MAKRAKTLARKHYGSTVTLPDDVFAEVQEYRRKCYPEPTLKAVVSALVRMGMEHASGRGDA